MEALKILHVAESQLLHSALKSAFNALPGQEDEPKMEIVRGASTAEEALKACIDESFALVLMDIHLPKKNGYDTAREIVELNPDQKILIISNQGTAENLRRCIAAKASGQISRNCSVKELYEAAHLDGAGPFQRLRLITLPMISPSIFFNIVIGIIFVWQIFVVPYIMIPDGGPGRNAYFFTSYLYDTAFMNQRFGYACLLSWVQLGIILALTALAFRVSRNRVHYRGAGA